MKNSLAWLRARTLCPIMLLVFVLPQGLGAGESNKNKITSLKVVTDDNYPPFIFRGGDGNLKGILLDQWALWEKKTGIKVEISAMDWGEALQKMQAGEYDVIDTIFKNPNREKIYSFAKPYQKIDVPIFFHKDISGIHDLNDLKGFVIGVKAGDNVIDFLRGAGVFTIKEYPSYEEIVKSASEGKIKVFSVDRPPAMYFMYKMRIHELYKETEPLYTGEFHRAVLKGREELLPVLEDGFNKITKDEYAAIEKHWYGAPVISQSMLSSILIFIVSAMGVFLLFSFWVWSLRRKVAQKTKQLQVSNSYIKAVLDSVNDAVFVNDNGGSIIDVNQRFTVMYGYTMDEVLKMKIGDLSAGIPPYTQEDAVAYIMKCKKYGPQTFEWMAKTKTGNCFPVEVSIYQRTIGDNERFIVSVRDIRERKLAEIALRESEEKFRTTVASMADMVFAFDMDGIIIFFHAPPDADTFIERSKILGANPVNILPEDVLWQFNNAFEKNKKGEIAEYDYSMKLEGKDRWFSAIQSPRFIDSHFVGAIAVIREITDRKDFEAQTAESLKEKETLLRELYHRTKNNMQVVISLIAMQKAQMSDSPEKEMLADLQGRIQSMALVHQMLYRSQNLSRISLKEYIVDLTTLLFSSFKVDVSRIALKTELDEVSVSIDTAIPCGLVINELLTNALKHAFPDGRKGEIAVTLKNEANNAITLIVADNGIGVPENYVLEEQTRVGMKSILTISKNQLKGVIDFKKESGFWFKLTFTENGLRDGI